MPIFVDHEQRREAIVAAAVAVLGELGFAKFTLRAVSKRLGGSVTMVTHYFPSRDALLTRMLEQTLDEARSMQEQLASIPDPYDRIEAVVRYFLPIDREAMAVECARVAMVSHRNVEPAIKQHLALVEPGMRDLIRTAIQDLIPAEEVDPMVDLIRLWTSGVVLSAIEHPELWTPERQTAALQYFMRLIDLPVATS
ncbi:AcrR family transcriptional regulator [Kibdelosporangium banguiense]|uniref:AcrR family transcriptional regulator n=1 Tax=Kibdelosporangium banguiense TaxID=1365924 RepID=A0ABS4TUU3_9PSEU|nr:TetR family transcriptional regulator [Kibdelosporangium banguiense]MBP2328165.1 AcrR family transcriptional regulator [Kibdelosporangium banguiense]